MYLESVSFASTVPPTTSLSQTFALDEWPGIAEGDTESKVVPPIVPVLDLLMQVWQMLGLTGSYMSALVARVLDAVAVEARTT